MDRYVVFSHGKDAGPWGVKITALAGNARSEGYEVESVDYRGTDDPRERVNKLVEFCKELKGDLVLCGSSLGGYVSVAAASLLHARGVFLMAPALTMGFVGRPVLSSTAITESNPRPVLFVPSCAAASATPI